MSAGLHQCVQQPGGWKGSPASACCHHHCRLRRPTGELARSSAAAARAFSEAIVRSPESFGVARHPSLRSRGGRNLALVKSKSMQGVREPALVARASLIRRDICLHLHITLPKIQVVMCPLVHGSCHADLCGIVAVDLKRGNRQSK